jgi:hypothetical protein
LVLNENQTGVGPEGPRVSFIISTGITFYKKGHKKPESCKPTLRICTKDLRRKIGKAIHSTTFSTAIRIIAVNFHVAGDATTWDEDMGTNSANTRGSPRWFDSLEVDVEHKADDRKMQPS